MWHEERRYYKKLEFSERRLRIEVSIRWETNECKYPKGYFENDEILTKEKQVQKVV